jgi:hypothetical protein
MILVLFGAVLWLATGFSLMYLVDHSTGYAMGRDLIRRRNCLWLSPAGVMFWLVLLWPAGLVWYWRKWRRA